MGGGGLRERPIEGGGEELSSKGGHYDKGELRIRIFIYYIYIFEFKSLYMHAIQACILLIR